MPHVIHVNDKLALAGGVEVYIAELQPLLLEAGYSSEWIAIARDRANFVVRSGANGVEWTGAAEDLGGSPMADRVRQARGLFHVHSLSEPRVVEALFRLAPVVRTMHEPRAFCPGQGKFWERSETPCVRPFGAHCFWNAYKERCCNRHPKRLVAAFRNASFEVRHAAKHYFKLIAFSNYIRNEAVLAGMPRDKIVVFPCHTPRTAVPIEQGHPKRQVVFVGRLSRSKGVHHLLRAWDMVRRTIAETHLHLVGGGTDERRFRSLANELDLTADVSFHGWADRSTVDRYLSSATVVAFPSIYPEAFGMVGIEAMMRGRPVVGYDVGGVKDWLSDRVSGILVRPKDVSGFADALIELLSDREKSERYGRAGRAIALERFSPETHIEKLLAIYDSALASTRSES